MRAAGLYGHTALQVVLTLAFFPGDGPTALPKAMLVAALVGVFAAEAVIYHKARPGAPAPRAPILPFILSGFMPLLGILHTSRGGDLLLPSNPALLASAALIVVAGVLLRLSAFATLGDKFLQTIVIRDDHVLVTRGPYAVVRNPALLGYVLEIAGCAALTLSIPALVLSVTLAAVAVRIFVRQEEACLTLAFGEDYRRYAARTGRYLPRLRRPIPRATEPAAASAAPEAGRPR